MRLYEETGETQWRDLARFFLDVRGAEPNTFALEENRRRAEKGLLAGLWEFPSLDGFRTEEELRTLFPEASAITPCGVARHLFTHVEWRMRGFLVELPSELPGFVWETAETIRRDYSVPTALKFFLKLL